MQQYTAYSSIAANAATGQFGAAAESVKELHNPIFRINAAMVEAGNNAKQMGLSMEDAMMNASLRANILVTRMEMIKARFMGLPRAFMNQMNRGLSVEADRIGAAAGIMRSEYAKSIPEAQKIISQVRKVVIRESAPLPGDTQTHLDVLSQTIDDSMGMAKRAGKSVEEAQKFAAEVAGQIGSIGGAAGANRDSTIRFANALMSGSLTANSRLDLVERNPGVKNAMKDVLKKQGASSISEVARDKQAGVIAEILKKAMPASQMEAASDSFGGIMEGFNTSKNALTDFTRTVNAFGEDYEGPDVTVFNEVAGVATRMIKPLSELLDAIASNPITDPMANMARVINRLNGFLGNSTAKVEDFAGMDLQEAVGDLGLLDFGKYLEANAKELIDMTVRGDRFIAGQDVEGGTFAAKNLGQDVPSRVINALVSKFRTGVDGFFSEVNSFVKSATFINGLDLGGSMGVVIAEVTNSVVHLFNQLLPVIISQTTSMFRRFKEQLDLGELIRFLQLFGGFKNIWTQMQEKLSKLAEDAPKYFQQFTGGLLKFSGTFAIVGTVVTVFGGIVGMAAVKINKAATMLVKYIAEKTGQTNIADNMQERLTGINDAKERLRIDKLSEQQRAAEGITNFTYSDEDRKADLKTVRGNTAGTFLEQHEKYTDMFSSFNFDPANFLNRFNSSEDPRKNVIQKVSEGLGKANYPLMVAGMMGLAPEPLSNTVIGAGLATGAIGNITRLMGFKGMDPESDEAKAKEKQKAREGTYRSLLANAVQSGDREKVGKIMNRINREGVNVLGPIGKFLNFIPGVGKLISKIPPGMLTALSTALPHLMGTVQIVIGVLKRAYEASPELQRAVARFFNGLRNLFQKVSRIIAPLYNKYVLPVFKVIGDFLAMIFNKIMDFLNFFTGGAFGDANTVPVGKEQATETSESILIQRTEIEQQQIKAGQQGVGNAYKGYTPGTQVFNAARGFGEVNIPSLMQAATLENKMMPANEQLIMANTSETILTAEQMRSGRLMRESSNNITIPKVDIMINAHGNQDPTAIANEVATVLMSKIREQSNAA